MPVLSVKVGAPYPGQLYHLLSRYITFQPPQRKKHVHKHLG